MKPYLDSITRARTECEKHGHKFESNSMYDMQGHCTVCGAPEE